jgi:hypothetical protein
MSDDIDVFCEQWAAKMVGQPFEELQEQLESKGYSMASKLIRVPGSPTGTVLVAKGHHEHKMQFRITFSWKEKYHGMSVPDKVTAAKWIRPMRPEPFEVR